MEFWRIDLGGCRRGHDERRKTTLGAAVITQVSFTEVERNGQDSDLRVNVWQGEVTHLCSGCNDNHQDRDLRRKRASGVDAAFGFGCVVWALGPPSGDISWVEGYKCLKLWRER